jgi:uncharacterized protein YoxC
MSFFDWMNMNMIIDIAFLVFSCAIIWKFRKISKRIEQCDSTVKSIEQSMISHREDINIVMKNPQSARRLLKEREQ